MAVLAPGAAQAGAWVAPKGGQEILTTVAGQREGLVFYETAAYWETPLGDATSLVAAPWLEQNYDTIEGWRAEAVVGFKSALYRSEDAAVAAQVGGLWLSAPVAACGESGAEFRLLAGYNLSSRSFLNVEAASRLLDGGCASERLDLTLGRRFGERWLAMGQVFVDRAGGDDEAVRTQITLTRIGESGRGIQFGLRTRIDGDAEEAAFVLGFWGRPGERR